MECAPALVAVKVVRPVGRSTLTAPARRRRGEEAEAAGVCEDPAGPVASVLRVRVVADPKSR